MELIIQHKSNKSTSKSTQNGAWFPEWNPRVILACIEGAFVGFALNLRMHSFHPCHYSFHPFNTNQGEIVLWRTLFRFVALSRFVRFRFFPLFVWRMQGINFQAAQANPTKALRKSTENGAWFPEWNPRVVPVDIAVPLLELR